MSHEEKKVQEKNDSEIEANDECLFTIVKFEEEQNMEVGVDQKADGTSEIIIEPEEISDLFR